MTYSNTSIAALTAAAFLALVGCGDRGADNTGQTDSGVSDTAPATDTGVGATGGAAGDYATDTPPSDMSQGQTDGTQPGGAMDPNSGSATDMQEGATSDQAGDTAGSTKPQQ